MPRAASLQNPRADWNAAILLTAGLTLARLVALFRTPLELYPDEAQYWLWSRALDFGYFSKPPMVAWAIWATTHLGGDAEGFVRLSAPLFQAGATLCAFALGRRLYGSAAGLAAAALYALMPAVQLSSFVVATDAPLLFFTGLALVAYAGLQSATGARRLGLAAGLGAALGLAFLSKYAVLYVLIGMVLHLALSREARRAWSLAAALTALAVFAAVVAPNIIWNASHGFATLHHTASNAAWGQRTPFNPGHFANFLIAQAGVFGPIPFGALVVGIVLAARRRALSREDLMLLCFVLPALVIVSVQALLSRANANWAAISYLPASVLVAGWLLRWRARRWLTAAVALQAAMAAAVLVAVVNPRFVDLAGGSNSLKRVRGWAQTANLVTDRARVEEGGGLSAVAVDNRFLYYALAYYGRDYFGRPGAAPLTYWLREGEPRNQAEANAPLVVANGSRVVAVSYEGRYVKQMTGDFARTLGREIDSVSLDAKHRRKIVMFVGEGFRPAPRPVSGQPTRP